MVIFPTLKHHTVIDLCSLAIWSQEAWKSPTCVFSPLTPQILASGLQVLVSGGVYFAIRSGGHMPVAGHNSFGRYDAGSDYGFLIMQLNG